VTQSKKNNKGGDARDKRGKNVDKTRALKGGTLLETLIRQLQGGCSTQTERREKGDAVRRGGFFESSGKRELKRGSQV